MRRGPSGAVLTRAEARRVALAAQGFGEGRPEGAIGPRHPRRVLDRIGLLQIDSVSIVARAHYLPLYSRLGDYPRALLDASAWGRKRTLFEYWAHEASLLPLALHPLMRWRMERASRGVGIYGGLATFGAERRDYIEAVYREVEARGAIGAGDLDGQRGLGGWWGWSDAKRALEWLFWAGRVTAATRRASFERLYDLPERVLPADILALPTPTAEEAQRDLLRVAARALGVATASDLRDYFRLEAAETPARLAELVEAGDLEPVTVEGWSNPAYLHRDARKIPRRIEARALLAPFDPLVWERPRAERLFGFRYRLEIYTPAAKRQHGYYVLPFLLGDRLVGRVDLKADRAAGVLRVLSVHAEPGAPLHAHDALEAELALMARWLGLGAVERAVPVRTAG